MAKQKYIPFHPEDAKNYIIVYWGYYQYLEEEYRLIFSSNNINPYRAVSLYLSIGSEIDVLLKAICLILNENYEGNNICLHRNELNQLIESGDWDDYDISVMLLPNEVLSPWHDEHPQWWKNYNLVKHQRALKDNAGALYFSYATQDNIKNALAALYILEEQYLTFIKEYSFYEDSDFEKCKSTLFA